MRCRAKTVLSSLFTDFNIILTRKVTALFAQFYRTLFCTILLHNTKYIELKVQSVNYFYSSVLYPGGAWSLLVKSYKM